MKTNKPKSLQAQLQSRISKRASVINNLEWEIAWEKRYLPLYAGSLHANRQKLKDLAEDQKFEKSILANTYWR